MCYNDDLILFLSNSSCGLWLWAKSSLSGYMFVSVLSIVIVCHFVVISTITYSWHK
jgi:hypothetical protein